MSETPEAAYERGSRDGRAAAVERIRLLARREGFRSSERYVRGIRAAEIVAENLDLSGWPLPDNYCNRLDLAEEDELRRLADGEEP